MKLVRSGIVPGPDKAECVGCRKVDPNDEMAMRAALEADCTCLKFCGSPFCRLADPTEPSGRREV